jgi:hypothetical protein
MSRQKKKKKKSFYLNKQTSIHTVNMSTSASTQNILTIVKDEFAEVVTEGTLSPTAKPADWNVIITEKALLETMKTPSPPPEQVRHGLASLYDNKFPTHEEY